MLSILYLGTLGKKLARNFPHYFLGHSLIYSFIQQIFLKAYAVLNQNLMEILFIHSYEKITKYLF